MDMSTVDLVDLVEQVEQVEQVQGVQGVRGEWVKQEQGRRNLMKMGLDCLRRRMYGSNLNR